MKKTICILGLTAMLSSVFSATALAEWVEKDGFVGYKKSDGSLICDEVHVINTMRFYFDKEGRAISVGIPVEILNKQEEKIQHIRDMFYGINARNDFFVMQSDGYIDFADNGMLVKAVLKNDYNLMMTNNIILPVVEYYYENNKVIFIYANDGMNEYRYYFENGNLIREIGPDGVVFDYPDGDGFQKTVNVNVEQIYGRGIWEAALFAEDYWGVG